MYMQGCLLVLVFHHQLPLLFQCFLLLPPLLLASIFNCFYTCCVYFLLFACYCRQTGTSTQLRDTMQSRIVSQGLPVYDFVGTQLAQSLEIGTVDDKQQQQCPSYDSCSYTPSMLAVDHECVLFRTCTVEYTVLSVGP